MNTRPTCWNDDRKGENSRWILKKANLHTLFTPLYIKTVNFVYNGERQAGDATTASACQVGLNQSGLE